MTKILFFFGPIISLLITERLHIPSVLIAAALYLLLARKWRVQLTISAEE